MKKYLCLLPLAFTTLAMLITNLYCFFIEVNFLTSRLTILILATVIYVVYTFRKNKENVISLIPQAVGLVIAIAHYLLFMTGLYSNLGSYTALMYVFVYLPPFIVAYIVCFIVNFSRAFVNRAEQENQVIEAK